MLLPPRSSIITYEQSLLHDIVRGVILHFFREEVAERGSRRCCVTDNGNYEVEHSDAFATHFWHIKTAEWPEVFASMKFDIPAIRELYTKVARSFGINPNLISFSEAIRIHLNYEDIYAFRPQCRNILERIANPKNERYVSTQYTLETVLDYNLYLALRAAKEVASGDFLRLFNYLCCKLDFVCGDFYYLFYDIDIPNVEPKLYRQYVMLAKTIY